MRPLFVPMQAFSVLFRRSSAAGILFLLLVQGCARFHPHDNREYVYVWLKGTYLRDRVAVVSNRVAEVANGQRLQVLDHGRRFLKVKTEKGEVGWIEEHWVIDQKTFDSFSQMVKEHEHDPVVATGVLRDEYWLRDAPGRKSDRFYLLPENDKLQLLQRASVPKPQAAQALPIPAEKPVDHEKNAPPPEPPPPPLEDYWLIRDGAGHVGWVRGRLVDEDVPDAIAGLAEGQKIVGAYILKKVEDLDAKVPGNQVPEYLAALAPWRDGLPYDFDQIRVFTWNVRKHRYETAYRERNIAGYLPVTVSKQVFDKGQVEPVFSYRVATGDVPALDPQTGMVRPGQTQAESFRLEGVLVRRIGDQPAHPAASTPGDSEHRHRPRARHRRRR
jgi:hypothetical protein